MPTVSETPSFGSFSRKIEVAANIATIVVAILLSVALVKNFLIPASTSRPTLRARNTNYVKVGTNLNSRVPGVDWNKNGSTLVLILSTRCHYCTESAPFFRALREKVGSNVKVVALLPQPVKEAEAYLNNEGVHLDEVKQASLDKVGIAGTPTMLLVNHKGSVVDTWVGKLEPDKQSEALAAILHFPSKEN